MKGHQMYVLLAVIVLTAVGGCATQKDFQWTKVGMTREQLARDNYDCTQQSTTPYAGPLCILPLFAAQAQSRSEDLYRQCMEARGYAGEQIAQASAGTPVISVTATAAAATLADSHERAVREFVRLAMGSSGLDVFAAQLRDLLTSLVILELQSQWGRPPVEAEQAVVRDVVGRVTAEVLPISKWEDEVVKVYAKYFSEAEVKEMARFYQTPVGAKSARLTGVISAELAALGQQFGQSKELHRRLDEELSKAFPGK